jgi:hypothetical protein
MSLALPSNAWHQQFENTIEHFYALAALAIMTWGVATTDEKGEVER